jgi:DNA-binding MarR family transcriptional regulator
LVAPIFMPLRRAPIAAEQHRHDAVRSVIKRRAAEFKVAPSILRQYLSIDLLQFAQRTTARGSVVRRTTESHVTPGQFLSRGERKMTERLQREEDDRLLFWLKRRIIVMVRAKGPDLNLRQLAILLVSETADHPVTVKSLNLTIGLSKPAITRSIDRLAAFKLVRRLPDPQDRRSVLVEVMPSGHALCRRLAKARKAADPVNPNKT